MIGIHIVYGLVTEWKAGYARVQLQTFDDGEGNAIVTDWLPIMKARAMNDDENWPFEVNEQVACIIDKHCQTGVILGAMTNDVDVPDADAAAGKYRKKFSDGTFIEYDKNSHAMQVQVPDNSGKINVTVGSKTSMLLTNATIDAKVNNTELVLTDGQVQAKDGHGATITITGGNVQCEDNAGGELQISGGLFSIENSSQDLGAILQNILTAIQLITVGTGVGPSSIPVNAASFAAAATQLSALLT